MLHNVTIYSIHGSYGYNEPVSSIFHWNGRVSRPDLLSPLFFFHLGSSLCPQPPAAIRCIASDGTARHTASTWRRTAAQGATPGQGPGWVFTVLWVDSLGASKQTYCTFTTTCCPTGPTVQSVTHFLDHTANRPSSPCDFSPLRDRIQSTGAKRARPTKYWLQETETKLLTFFCASP